MQRVLHLPSVWLACVFSRQVDNSLLALSGLLLLSFPRGLPPPPGLLCIHLPRPPLGNLVAICQVRTRNSICVFLGICLFFSPSLLPPLPKALLVALPPASRAAVGAIFLTVAALTVERYSLADIHVYVGVLSFTVERYSLAHIYSLLYCGVFWSHIFDTHGFFCQC